MVNFLPSEIARLVFGYMQEIGCTEIAKLFLQSCSHLNECRQVFESGRTFSTKVNELTLIEMLDQWCSLRSLVQGYSIDDINDSTFYNELLSIFDKRSNQKNIAIFNKNRLHLSPRKYYSLKLNVTRSTASYEAINSITSRPELITSSTLKRDAELIEKEYNLNESDSLSEMPPEFEPVDDFDCDGEPIHLNNCNNNINYAEFLANEDVAIPSNSAIDNNSEQLSSISTALLTAKPNESISSSSSEYIHEVEPLEEASYFDKSISLSSLNNLPFGSDDEQVNDLETVDSLKDANYKNHLPKVTSSIQLLPMPLFSPHSVDDSNDVHDDIDVPVDGIVLPHDNFDIEPERVEENEETDRVIDPGDLQMNSFDKTGEIEENVPAGDQVIEVIASEDLPADNFDAPGKAGEDEESPATLNPVSDDLQTNHFDAEPEKNVENVSALVECDFVLTAVGEAFKVGNEDQVITSEDSPADNFDVAPGKTGENEENPATLNPVIDSDDLQTNHFDAEPEKDGKNISDQCTANLDKASTDSFSPSDIITENDPVECVKNKTSKTDDVGDDTINSDSPLNRTKDSETEGDFIFIDNPIEISKNEPEEELNDVIIIDSPKGMSKNHQVMEEISNNISFSETLKEIFKVVEKDKDSSINSNSKVDEYVEETYTVEVIDKEENDFNKNKIGIYSQLNGLADKSNDTKKYCFNKMNLEIEKPKEQNDKYLVVDSLDIPIESTVEIESVSIHSKDDLMVPLEEGITDDDLIIDKVVLSNDLTNDNDTSNKRKSSGFRRPVNFAEKNQQNCRKIVEKSAINPQRKSKRISLNKTRSKLRVNYDDDDEISNENDKVQVNSVEISCVYDKKTAKKRKEPKEPQEIEYEYGLKLVKSDTGEEINREEVLTLRTTPLECILSIEPKEKELDSSSPESGASTSTAVVRRKYKTKRRSYQPPPKPPKRKSSEALENFKENCKDTQYELKRRRMSDTTFELVRKSMNSKFPIVLLERLDINKYNKPT